MREWLTLGEPLLRTMDAPKVKVGDIVHITVTTLSPLGDIDADYRVTDVSRDGTVSVESLE